MDQTTPPTLACHNCKTVVTDGGQQVWVCERCGEENHVPTLDEQNAQAMIDAAAAAAPVVPEIPETSAPTVVPPVPTAKIL